MDIRQYTPADRETVEALMTELQMHIAGMDPQGLHLKNEDFNVHAYFDDMLRKLANSKGILLVADEQGDIHGFIAGTIADAADSLDWYPVKHGIIHELVVESGQRGKNIGSTLMQSIEEYFQLNSCDFATVKCFIPNSGAHRFYNRNGYEDRTIDMLKKL